MNNLQSSSRLGQHYTRYPNQTNVSPVNNQPLSQHGNVSQVYSQEGNQQRSLTLEPEIKYDSYEYYLVVRSEDRDTTNYPQPQSYRVPIEHDLKNIYSVELIEGYIPDQNNVTQEPYLILDIPELRDHPMISTSSVISNAFTILQMSSPVTSGYFIWFDKRTHENTVKYYRNSKAQLKHLTINIKDNLGNLFDFGDDTAGSPPNKALQNMFIFKIVVREKTHDTLNYRNVF
ncbi:hypothetical protein SAGO17_00114 [Mimivirus AB-566-O17]|uniref:Uncharacterized protein n=1 Tax=Mimivirus AB-566-O17 TaxID=1988039 RepID=A0A1X9VNX1_9VIRU|nr:hypothetical protein SAGO17_00114 [Mimivirus AB-566-O17]